MLPFFISPSSLTITSQIGWIAHRRMDWGIFWTRPLCFTAQHGNAVLHALLFGLWPGIDPGPTVLGERITMELPAPHGYRWFDAQFETWDLFLNNHHNFSCSLRNQSLQHIEDDRPRIDGLKPSCWRSAQSRKKESLKWNGEGLTACRCDIPSPQTSQTHG